MKTELQKLREAIDDLSAREGAVEGRGDAYRALDALEAALDAQQCPHGALRLQPCTSCVLPRLPAGDGYDFKPGRDLR